MRVSAAAYVWTGASSVNWGTGGNWKVGVVVQAVPPTASDDVTIPATATPPTVNVTSVCKSLTISATATLTLSANLTISGAISVTSGTFTLATGSNFTIAATGALTTNSLTGINIKANNTITCASVTLGQQSTFSNAATITTAGNFSIGTLIGSVGSPATNSGTINESSGTFNIGQQSFLSNSGTLGITGIFNIVTQSALINSGTVSVSGTATVGQQSYINSTAGSITFSSTLSIVTLGYITNAGAFSVNGNITINQQSYISNSGTFTTLGNIGIVTQGYISNSGTFDSSACAVSLGQQSYIKNLAGGTYSLYNNSSVSFVTQAYIDNAGTFYGGKSNSPCTFTINTQQSYMLNSAAASKFYLGSTSYIILTGISAYVTNTSPGVFTLQSDQYGSATIEAITNGATINGIYEVERFIYGNNALNRRDYRLFSSPVYTSSQTLAALGSHKVYDFKYLNNTSASTQPITTGTGGVANGFDKTGNPTIYLYREDRNALNSVFSGGNYIGLSNINNIQLGYDSYNNTTTLGYLPIGNGFAFFFRGSKANLVGRTSLPIAPAYYPDDATVTQVGQINQGTIPVILWYNNATANSYQTTLSFTAANITTQGFNLVGNPYPSSIDWSTFSNTVAGAPIYGLNVNPTIYEFDPTASTNVFGTYNKQTGTALNNGNKIIVSGQGFFVQTSTTGATLQFTESAKSNTQLVAGSTLLMGTPVNNTAYNQDLRLTLHKDTLIKNEVLIGFNSSSSDIYNSQEDDSYIPGFSASQNFWVTSGDNVKLVSKWLTLPKTGEQKVINVSVYATTSGQYTITRGELKAIPDLYDIWLIDKYKKDSLDIKHHTDYVFELNTADTNTFGSNRFQIIIRQNPALGVRLLNFTAKKAPDGAQTTWKTENEENYTNFTVERSTNNGLTFNTLGGFASNAQGTYSFLDKAPPDSTDAYRLKMVDMNGAISYSDVITLMYSNSANNLAANNISVYPNPASGVINLAINESSYPAQNKISASNQSALQTTSTSPALTLPSTGSQSYEIKIINMMGSVLRTATSAQATWQDNVGNLPPGTYIIQVINSTNKSTVGKSTFIKL